MLLLLSICFKLATYIAITSEKANSSQQRAIKQHFKQARESGLLSNLAFWNLVKPVLSNKGGFAGSDISLIKNNVILTEARKSTEIFNDQYINIVDKPSDVVGPGRKPSKPHFDGPIRRRISEEDRRNVRTTFMKCNQDKKLLEISRIF